VRNPLTGTLPGFPWDSLAEAKAAARAHPDGIADLSVGTPVDPVAPVIREALASVAEVPGYPTTAGTPQLQEAALGALRRRFGIGAGDGAARIAMVPAVGTKEMIASLPSHLGMGSTDTIVIPELAYPTYEVGALLAGARPVRADGTAQLGPAPVSMIFLNSPANPSGKILGVPHLRKVVDWARLRGAIVVSDECYLGLPWDDEAVSILDDRVHDGDVSGLIAVHSLSKTSSLASYRAGFAAGDPELLGELLEVRKHAGLMLPLPVQAAMTAALSDDGHEAAQRERYRRRRDILRPAVEKAGFRVDDSAGGLYLWATRDEPCRETVDRLARLGILVAPGDFYGPRGARHVRIALTASDERIAAAANRLTAAA